MDRQNWMNVAMIASIITLVAAAALLGWKSFQAGSSPAGASRQLAQVRARAAQAPAVVPPSDVQLVGVKRSR